MKLKSERNRGTRIIDRKIKEISDEINKPKTDPMFWYKQGFTVTYEEMFKNVQGLD